MPHLFDRLSGDALEYSAIGDVPIYTTIGQGILAAVADSAMAKGDSCVNVLTLIPRQHQY